MQRTVAIAAMTASVTNAWRSSPVVTDYQAVEDFGANGKDHGFG